MVSDPLAAAAASAAEKFGATVADSPEAVFASGIDGVVVTAATDAHPGLILAAVEAGIPVFCEKPVAKTIEESLDVLRAVENSDVQVQIGFGRAPRKSQVTDTYSDACGLRRDGRAAHAPWAPDEGCKEPSYRTDRTDDESTVFIPRRSQLEGHLKTIMDRSTHRRMTGQVGPRHDKSCTATSAGFAADRILRCAEDLPVGRRNPRTGSGVITGPQRFVGHSGVTRYPILTWPVT